MSVTTRCWNCNALYEARSTNAQRSTHCETFYCSDKCMCEDDAKLTEGNKIIAEAQKLETEFKPLDAIRLDTQGPIGQALKGLHIPSMIKHNSSTEGENSVVAHSADVIREVTNFPIQAQADAYERVNKHEEVIIEHVITNEYDKNGNLS